MINFQFINEIIVAATVSFLVSWKMLTISNKSNKIIKFKEDLCRECSDIHRIAFKNSPEQHEEDVHYYLSDMEETIKRVDYISVISRELITDKLKNLRYQYTDLTRDDKTLEEKGLAKVEIGENISTIKRIIDEI